MSKRRPQMPAVPMPPPDSREQRAIKDSENRIRARRRPVAIKVEMTGENAMSLGPRHADTAGYSARLADAFGTASADFINAELYRLGNTLEPRQPGYELRLNAAVALIESIRPTNELEATLAIQMAVTHALSMKSLERLQASTMIPQADSAATVASKLQRTFLQQIEALSKLRRGGQQNVRVEHVHVHSGGQAIVGTVTHTGGGDTNEFDGQGYKPGSALEERSEVRCENALGNVVPIAGIAR